jgi:hypothetical protein
VSESIAPNSAELARGKVQCRAASNDYEVDTRWISPLRVLAPDPPEMQASLEFR